MIHIKVVRLARISVGETQTLRTHVAAVKNIHFIAILHREFWSYVIGWHVFLQ